MANHRLERKFRIVLPFILSLAFLLMPVSAIAAPAALQLSETTIYEDVDGFYEIAVPDAFSEQYYVDYDMMADNELDDLLESWGIAFVEPDSENGLSVLLLLLDETITDENVFGQFVGAFQEAAGGESLPLIDFELVDDDILHAAGSIATRDRHLQVDIQAWENVAAIVSASVERTDYSKYREDLRESLEGFVWDPEVVSAGLGSSEQPPSKDEPTDTSDAASGDLTVERFYDDNNVYTISIPTDLVDEDLSDEEEAIYGDGFFVDGADEPTLVVAFTPLQYAANDATGEIDFREVDDGEWNAFIETFIINDLSDLDVITDERDALNRTAFIVLQADEGDENNPEEVWVWLEESNGVGAVFAIFGKADDPVNSEIFHEAVTTFTWWPQEAATVVADVAGVPDPQDYPVALDDPFGLLQVSHQPMFPFQGARFNDNGLDYTFSGDSLVGMSQVSLFQSENGPISDADWEFIVAEHEDVIPSLMDDDPANPSGRVESSERDLPFLDADRSVFTQGYSDEYWIGSLIMEKDGVVALYITVVQEFYFDSFENEVLAVIEQGLDYDPDAVREVLDEYVGLGATVLDAATVAEAPVEGEELSEVFRFDRLDGFNLAIDFSESDLESSLKAVVRSVDMPNYPVAQYALWLGEEQLQASGMMTTQNESGTRAAFYYAPDFAMNIGDYVADVYYDNTLVAALAFHVNEELPEESYLQHFSPAYNNDVDEPMVNTTAIHPADVLTMRGSANLPTGSQVRLLWYDPDGWLLTDEVQTIRLENSFYAPLDWIYFEPDIDWMNGYYTWVLTVDGEPFETGDLFVVEETEIAELTAAGENIYSILPIPQDLAMDLEVDGIDYIIQTTEEIPGMDIVSAIDATLRWQGWEPALPPVGSPVEIGYRRWTKDGYQFVVEEGAEGFEDELWLRYTTADSAEYGSLPSGEEITTTNLDLIDSVARIEIEDLWIDDAAISPDGNWLAVTTSDGTLYIFDALRMLDAMWYQPNVYYANPVFSPNSHELAVTVDLQSRSEVQVFSNFDIVWLPTTRLNGHTNQVSDIVYQPDGWIASGGLDSSIRYWNTTDTTWPYMVETDESIAGLAAAPDEESGLFVGHHGGTIDYMLDSTEDDAWSGLGSITQSPRVAAWSELDADGVGDLIAFGEGQAEWYSYDIEDVALNADMPMDNADFQSTSAAFSNNGELLVIGGPYVTFADRATGEALGDWNVTIDEEIVPIVNLDFSPDSQYVIVVDDYGYLRLWAVPAQ